MAPPIFLPCLEIPGQLTPPYPALESCFGPKLPEIQGGKTSPRKLFAEIQGKKASPRKKFFGPPNLKILSTSLLSCTLRSWIRY